MISKSCFLQILGSFRKVELSLPLKDKLMFKNPRRRIVPKALQGYYHELKQVVMRCPISQRQFRINKCSLFQTFVDCHSVEVSLCNVDTSTANIQKRRGLAVSSLDVAEIKIHLKHAMHRT